MTNKLVLVFATIASLACARPLNAADARAELQGLIGKIQAKVQSGTTTEKGFADEIKAFDSLLAEHKAEKTEEVAHILLMKAQLYNEVLDDDVKATMFLKELKAGFPGTETGKSADEMIESIQRQAEAKKIQRALVKGSKFPDFDVRISTGSRYRSPITEARLL